MRLGEHGDLIGFICYGEGFFAKPTHRLMDLGAQRVFIFIAPCSPAFGEL